MNNQYRKIPLDKIIDPARPLRSDLSPESVMDLVGSIKQVGVIEPLVVARRGELFEVVAGHRRLLAADIAGVAILPCLVVEADEMQVEILKLHENIARAEINPVDWGRHLLYLKTHYNMTTAKLADLLGMSEPWVEQHLKINNYPPEMLEAMEAGKLAFSAARELVQIKDPLKRKMHIGYAVKGGVTPNLAAEWRRKANAVPLEYPTTPESGESSTNPPSVIEVNMICAVCHETIPMEEAVTVTIHADCRPIVD